MESSDDYIVLFILLSFISGIVSICKLFSKAGEQWWVGLIPVMNLFVITKLAGLSYLFAFLLFVPYLNILIFIMIVYGLSRSFGQNFFFFLGMLFLGIIFFPILAFGKSKYVFKTTSNNIYNGQIMQNQNPVSNSNGGNGSVHTGNSQTKKEKIKSPLVLSDLIQPGFIGKIYSIFFMEEGMVIVKIGSGTTNSSGSMRAALGGATGIATIMSGVGKFIDGESSRKRREALEVLAGNSIQGMLAADPTNFFLPYDAVQMIELKGPSWFGELKVRIIAGSEHKFRVETYSDYMGNYFFNTFKEYLPGKVTRIK